MGVHKTMEGALAAIRKKLDDVPNNIAEDVKSKSEDVTPVKTGFLKSNYKIEKSSGIGDDAVTFNDAPYAAYVEFGTPRMAPRGMMGTGAARINKNGSVYIRKRT